MSWAYLRKLSVTNMSIPFTAGRCLSGPTTTIELTASCFWCKAFDCPARPELQIAIVGPAIEATDLNGARAATCYSDTRPIDPGIALNFGCHFHFHFLPSVSARHDFRFACFRELLGHGA